MSYLFRNLILIGTFALVAGFGIFVSVMAPYISSGDELVYLTGTLQAREGNLPDAYMLQGYDYGIYLYPKVMSWWYESLGHFIFKSIYLSLLIFATGFSAYFLFRTLGLPWVPALLFAVITLFPRFSSGTEVFGILTFHEAIGRQAALPLFFIGTAFLVRRTIEKKSLWPIFGILGFCLFLHPVTVMLFSFISLIAVGVVRLFQCVPIIKIFREIIISGTVFVFSGLYFFIDVFKKLASGLASQGVPSDLYIQAITLRNTWEFPPESVFFFRHMIIISIFFVLLVIFYHRLPALRYLAREHPLSHGKEITIWGVAIAVGAIVFTIVMPGINLYFMEHFDVPYIFQQWSRISKFYYLGLFVALTPVIYTFWGWYINSRFRFKILVATVFVALGIASSSFVFEVVQFGVGYDNFEKAYIPQALSGISNDPTAKEYREVCYALKKLGAKPSSPIISSNFAFRYYCKADLYVTYEEGAAFQQLTRTDVTLWYDRYIRQRDALRDGDPATVFGFADDIGAEFVILPRIPKYLVFETRGGGRIATTTKYTVLKVDK